MVASLGTSWLVRRTDGFFHNFVLEIKCFTLTATTVFELISKCEIVNYALIYQMI